MDDIRVLLIVLVILHHVAASYGESSVWYYSEPVSGPGSALFFTFLMAVNQAFFMGFFFLLGGYFAPTSLQRKGAPAFLRDRVVRLGVPLLVYVLLIHPLVWRLGRGGGWQPGTGPMWFIEVLLIFTLVYVMTRRFVPALGAMPISKSSTTVLAVAMGTASFLARTRYPVDHWLTFPTIQPAHASQYVCLFAVGIWASGSDLAERITPALTRYWRRAMMMACVAAVVSFMSVDVPGDGKTNLEPLIGGWTWQSLVTSLWEQIIAVGLITNLLRLFGTTRREAGPIMSSAGVSTYTVYIIHPVVLVLLALALRGLPVPSLVKFLATAPIAVVLLFAIAHYVRQMPLLRHVL